MLHLDGLGVHLFRGAGGLFGVGRVLLGDLVHFRDGLVDLIDALGLFLGGRRYLVHQVSNFPGDLYVFLSVEPHEFFDRRGYDVYCRIPISFVQAALGAKIEVPTLTGTEKLKIPKGTQNATQFRLKGKGIPHIKGFGSGDQIIETTVAIPTSLTRKQEELLLEFAKLDNK
ncbi:MAG: Chaperone protein DnaJ [Syntrophus sp. PtaU1.Bin208]|nr:MAG: Chaperone protein DnaJ [Syntrophus sp. PtaU1.Bin208]